MESIHKKFDWEKIRQSCPQNKNGICQLMLKKVKANCNEVKACNYLFFYEQQSNSQYIPQIHLLNLRLQNKKYDQFIKKN